VEEKDATSRDDHERLKRLQGEMRQLAKEIRTETEERQASDDEASWQGLVDEADERVRGRRRRQAIETPA